MQLQTDLQERNPQHIGLGLAALGRPGYINLGHADDLQRDYAVDAMEQRAHVVLDAAYAAGVRYFDAARSYGRAEQFLASWVAARQFSSDELIIGSKWGYTYTADWQVAAPKHEVKSHTLPLLQRQWTESQMLLSDHLHLYQIHSATLESGVLTNRDVLSELARHKANGMPIGLSVSGAQQGVVVEQALAVEIDGVRLFDAVQATWNVFERSAETELRAAHDAGLAVIIKEALANGRLTSRNRVAAQRERLQAQADRLNTTIDALALAFVLSRDWVTVVLSGAARVEHLHSNLAAASVQLDEEAEAALGALTESAEPYWQTRKQLAWN